VPRKPPPSGGTHVERVGRGKGAAPTPQPEQDHLTADETLGWLQHETFAVSKEAELRIREATAIAIEYVRGQISPEEAGARRLRYEDRWGAGLGGMYTPDRMTDEQILKEMDDLAKWLREQEFARPGKSPSR
jgi:hypothetical protein